VDEAVRGEKGAVVNALLAIPIVILMVMILSALEAIDRKLGRMLEEDEE
jgi:ABC-type methionine transport system permease subunit